jgi:Flp pilus assembly protein TadD
VKRGLALLALQRPREALEDLQTAPDDPDARLGEGLALSALGRRDEARAALEAFVRLAPNHVGVTRARAELARLR